MKKIQRLAGWIHRQGIGLGRRGAWLWLWAWLCFN